MISLKSLLKTVREAKITSPKRGVETSLDAKIQIPGYGVMTRKQLQQSIKRYVNEVNKYVKKGDSSKALTVLYKRGVLKSFLETDIAHGGE